MAKNDNQKLVKTLIHYLVPEAILIIEKRWEKNKKNI